MVRFTAVALALAGSVAAQSPNFSQLFQSSPPVYNGPTATGSEPFVAETNPAPFNPAASFAAANPLETAIPIVGNVNNSNIFQLMGQLSGYFPNPTGFGVNEYPLPKGANITWLNMLSRHGSRYPTANSSQQALGALIATAQKNGTHFSGNLSFLNNWTYKLGYEVMVPLGREELYKSGVVHYYDYAHLYTPNTTIVARATSQERMRQSGENFLAGFFGLDWENYAKLEYPIELTGYNNTLAGYFQCNQSNTNVSSQGSTAQAQWYSTYLANALTRFNSQSTGFNWTIPLVFAAQGMCPYETVGLGYSAFCDLFTYPEWQGYEYGVDLSFYGNNMFGSPTGRGVGIGYVEEVLARLNNQYITVPTAQVNVTIDNNPTTFPLNQSLYFDFSHDTNIASVLTAFGLTQFSQFLPPTGPPANQQMIVSHMEPFGARLDIEVINAPHPVNPQRTGPSDAYSTPSSSGKSAVVAKDDAAVVTVTQTVTAPGCPPGTPTSGGSSPASTSGSSSPSSTSPTGPATKYIHFILNQRTIPLGKSIPACGQRTDGWCELNTFLNYGATLLNASEYAYSCFGNYKAVPYGTLSNGVPASS